MKKEYQVNLANQTKNEWKVIIKKVEDGRFEGLISYHRQTMPQKDYNGFNNAPIEPKKRNFSPVRGETEKKVLGIIKEILREQFGENVNVEIIPE